MFFFLDNTPIYCHKEYKFLSIIQFCDLLLVMIPRFCYHDKLAIAGNCRMCLVELNNGIKPVIACATNIMANVEIALDSLLVKKARENVLEFLLINHPLDCPICDQGGECDLQDQTLMYGSDRGRFKEMKRSVEDKELGPIVKTIMTRCIHCTRCIRFSEEVLGIRSLGVIGRGTSTEIKMVNTFFLNSELSGNIVDVCPVGALTSKPFAFTARPWELKSIESIDFLDSLHSNIRVDIKGSRIFRILPRQNNKINEDWITDFIRFSYESVQLFRIKFPYVSISSSATVGSNLFLRLEWEQCFEFAKLYFSTQNINSISLFAATNVGLFNINFFYFFSKLVKNSVFLLENIPFSNVDFRSFYLLNSFSEYMKSNFFIFYNLNIKENFSVFNARIQNFINNDFYKKYIFHIGKYVDYSYSMYHLGMNFFSFFSLLRGKNLNNHYFFRVLNRHINLNLFSASINFSNYIKMLNVFDDVQVNNLCFFSNVSGYSEHGITSNLVTAQETSSCDLSYYYKTEKLNNINSSFCYHGTYLPVAENMEVNSSYVFLPSYNQFEVEDYYINLFGNIQKANQSVDTSEKENVKSDFYIIKNFFFYFFYFFSKKNNNDVFFSFDYIFNDLVFYYLSYYVLFFEYFNFSFNLKKNTTQVGHSSSFFFPFSLNNLNISSSFFTLYSGTLSTFYRVRENSKLSSFF
jgi:NADH-quinone oxidoreductase chain G